MEYTCFFLSTDLENGHVALLTLTEIQNTAMANNITVLLHAYALHCIALLGTTKFDILLCVMFCFVCVIK
jgi:hypothetical protein